MPFIAVYDADVLYPNTLRDLLIRIAQLPHLVQAKWTEKILDEVTDNLRKNMPDITAEKTDRLRQLMNTAVRDCLVSGYEPLIAALDLPDPNDRHVLAAAIKAKAQIIVTKNLRDFPADRLAPWDLKAKSPDSFVRDLIDIDRQDEQRSQPLPNLTLRSRDEPGRERQPGLQAAAGTLHDREG
jgi:predicted nucleic acid-binding protein